MTKVFFILWFMIGSNNHTLNIVKFDTEAECMATISALKKTYDEMYSSLWLTLNIDYSRCIRVEVKE